MYNFWSWYKKVIVENTKTSGKREVLLSNQILRIRDWKVGDYINTEEIIVRIIDMKKKKNKKEIKMDNKIKLGVIVKDMITGFTGVVMAKSEYYTGCITYGILPQKMTKEARIPDWEWIDSKRLKRVGKNMIKFQDASVDYLSNEDGGEMEKAPEV